MKGTEPVMEKVRAEGLEERIREYVLRDGRVPGDRIETEEELARTFGVGRHRIRKALFSMVQHGLLIKRPRRGTVIGNFDASIAANNLQMAFQTHHYRRQECIEARLVIEQAVLPLAIRRITPQQITALEDAVARMRSCVDEPEKADAADRDFHMILLQSCGNEILTSFGSVIAMLFRDSAYRSAYWNPRTIRRLAKEHAQILAAVRNDDVELAVELHKNHLHYKQKLNL